MPRFDPTTYSPRYGALAGFALAHDLKIDRFEKLLDQKVLDGIEASLVGVDDAPGWRMHLIYDACIDRYGSFGGVIEGLGDF
jgi:hypothetical protein